MSNTRDVVVNLNSECALGKCYMSGVGKLHRNSEGVTVAADKLILDKDKSAWGCMPEVRNMTLFARYGQNSKVESTVTGDTSYGKINISSGLKVNSHLDSVGKADSFNYELEDKYYGNKFYGSVNNPKPSF